MSAAASACWSVCTTVCADWTASRASWQAWSSAPVWRALWQAAVSAVSLSCASFVSVSAVACAVTTACCWAASRAKSGLHRGGVDAAPAGPATCAPVPPPVLPPPERGFLVPVDGRLVPVELPLVDAVTVVRLGDLVGGQLGARPGQGGRGLREVGTQRGPVEDRRARCLP